MTLANDNYSPNKDGTQASAARVRGRVLSRCVRPLRQEASLWRNFEVLEQLGGSRCKPTPEWSKKIVPPVLQSQLPGEAVHRG